MNNYISTRLQRIHSASRRYGLDSTVFGPYTGYIDPCDVNNAIEFGKENGIHHIYFLGGQGNLMDVLNVFYKSGFQTMRMVNLQDQNFDGKMFSAICISDR